MEKYILDYEKLVLLIDSNIDLKIKYQQIRSQERFLLEYIIFSEYDSEDSLIFQKLTKAAVYISNLVASNQNHNFNATTNHMQISLQLLRLILTAESTRVLNEICDIIEFRSSPATSTSSFKQIS